MISNIKAFIKFSRPHTIAGTLLSISALYLMALAFSDRNSLHITEFILTLLSCLGANIFIVGLNQITDIEIDKINKPWLPIASGEFSKTTAWWIISIAVTGSLIIAIYIGYYLLITVILSLMLGTLYSLPPMRLKRYYFWAAFCIIAVRGLIVNLLLFQNFYFIMNGTSRIPGIVWVLTATIFIYSIVIAWFKDIPDMEGDKKFSIRTLSLQLGAKNVFYSGNTFLGCTILMLLVMQAVFILPVERYLFSAMHFLMLIILIIGIRITDINNRKSIRRFYLIVWILFFMEYISFGLGCILYKNI